MRKKKCCAEEVELNLRGFNSAKRKQKKENRRKKYSDLNKRPVEMRLNIAFVDETPSKLPTAADVQKRWN